MKILAVDTSSVATSIEIQERGRTLARYAETHDHPPSDMVFSLLEELLREATISLDDIDVYAACVGPGSFTGLRIGLGLAKTMAWARSKPVVGVDAVEVVARRALASGIVHDGDTFVAAVHGFQVTLFSARYLVDGTQLFRSGKLDWCDGIEALDVAPAETLVLPEDAPFEAPSARRVVAIEPSSAEIARAAAERLEKGEVPSFAAVQPIYLKPFSIGKKATIFGGGR